MLLGKCKRWLKTTFKKDKIRKLCKRSISIGQVNNNINVRFKKKFGKQKFRFMLYFLFSTPSYTWLTRLGLDASNIWGATKRSCCCRWLQELTIEWDPLLEPRWCGGGGDGGALRRYTLDIRQRKEDDDEECVQLCSIALSRCQFSPKACNLFNTDDAAPLSTAISSHHQPAELPYCLHCALTVQPCQGAPHATYSRNIQCS